MKKLSFLAICLSLVLMAGGVIATPVPVHGATDSKPLTIYFSVVSRATLYLNVNSIHFPASDPDLVPSIPAIENAVNVNAKVTALNGAISTLTHQASIDLGDGTDSIPITNITWTASGTGFVPGTMSKATPQTAGSFTGPGNFPGTFSYFLANSWTYTPGAYTASSTCTLTTP